MFTLVFAGFRNFDKNFKASPVRNSRARRALSLAETDDSRFGLIGSEAIMVVFSETYDSRFGLIGSEAIMV